MSDSTPQAADTPPPEKVVITAEDIYAYLCDPDGNSGLLAAEKRAQLDKDRSDPNSALRQVYLAADNSLRGQKKGGLSGLRRRLFGPGDKENHRPPGPNKVAASEREAIVRFVRDAVRRGRLPQAVAERVLAAGGESVSWIDSVPDRLLMEDLPVPGPGSATHKRAQIVGLSGALVELVEGQNRQMRAELAQTHPDLAAALTAALVAVNEPRDPGPGRA